MQTASSSRVAITPPSLPKGGGALTGMGESLGQAGPTGMSSLSLALPVSTGRGFAPSAGLNYSSGAGNDVFGLGWSCGLPAVSLRTQHGTPQYLGQDTYLGPDGEVLVPETDSSGTVKTTTISQYGGLTLSSTYTVTRYFPRIEGAFNRLEHWTSSQGDFWLLHGRDGTLHMLGKTAAARIADPSTPAHTAVWLIEESVSPIGEHIWYQYRAENSDNLPVDGRDQSAMRYLTQVNYGNTVANANLFLWVTDTKPAEQSWLFTLVFDYGERSTDPTVVPPFTPANGSSWTARKDAFSRYQYGFEVRTHRLCRQVLMFHHFPAEMGEEHSLISRMLMEYVESPILAQLSAVQTLAYESDGTLQSLPPLELGYSPANTDLSKAAWSALPNFPGVNNGLQYHLIDLYGEGIPGVLYQAGQDWRYCAPLRDSAKGADAVTWSQSWTSLPAVPAMQGRVLHLVDITGDGHLDQVVAQHGISGYFTLSSDGSWGDFTPFSALPLEYFHSQSQLAQLTGSGLADLVLVSPGTVRLYANTGAGFEVGLDVIQDESITLPVAGRDARSLVAFVDILGSGQSHLVEIRFNQVRCWPCLGRGRFGTPLTFAVDLDTETAFNPENLYLADTDGSGAPDLIYACHDRLEIFLNQSGNGFSAAQTLALPEGVFYDRLCQLTPADLSGNGCTGLVLTVPYMTPQHWYCTFSTQKPYLLSSYINNMGASHSLTYRGSAQYWLDEKHENPQAIPALPNTMPLLSQILATDNITGNTLSTLCDYRQGVYDGKEREFRGFGYLETHDTSTDALPTGDTTPLSAPLITRSWYHCGRKSDETSLYGSPFAGDTMAPELGLTRLTQWDAATAQDKAYTPDENSAWWMYRALKGSLLRSESWDANACIAAEGVPFICNSIRQQVRMVQSGTMPVVMPSQLEQIQLSYEELASDPAIAHQVVTGQDEFGNVLWQVNIDYPRRAEHSLTPYPDNLPDDAWSSSYDDQQTVLRINESRASVINLTDPQSWQPGLPSQQRENLITASALPAEAISFETLTASGGLLDASQTRYYRGQNEVFYTSSPLTSLPALISHTRSAVLDDVALQAYDGISELANFDFTSVGYEKINTVLDLNGVSPASVYAVSSGLTTYGTLANFYRTLTIQVTKLTSAISQEWDSYSLRVVTQTDSLGNKQHAEYDYRFLTPWRLTDINNNISEVQLDALGSVNGTSSYGTQEGGKATGFGKVTDYPVSPTLTASQAISNALADGYRQKIATISVEDLFCWMGQIALTDLSQDPTTAKAYWQTLLDARYICANGAVRAAGRLWGLSPESNTNVPPLLAPVLAAAGGMPVYGVQLVADNYPDNASQQTLISLSYSDGFGRSLQQCSRVAPGQAWQREDDGEVNTTEVNADPRWVVSGRVEYDNKGLPVRQYRPFFLNDWQYVVDSSLRTQGYCDTAYYDAIGRISHTVTAAGYLQRHSYYSWFTVSEDENDTEGLSKGVTL